MRITNETLINCPFQCVKTCKMLDGEQIGHHIAASPPKDKILC